MSSLLFNHYVILLSTILLTFFLPSPFTLDHLLCLLHSFFHYIHFPRHPLYILLTTSLHASIHSPLPSFFYSSLFTYLTSPSHSSSNFPLPLPTHLLPFHFPFTPAVEHPWQEYLKANGPSHLRRASRGLRLLTGQIRKIDETANIKGTLPRQLGFIVGLQEIYARRVGLIGRLPHELGELDQLRVLSMGNNQLCGELPASLGNLKHLQRIVLHQNKLTGQVRKCCGLKFFTL